MSETLAIAAVMFGCFVGVMMTVVRLPGTWVILSTAVLYAMFRGWPVGCKTMLTALAVIAVIAEVAEMAASYLLTQRAGASRYAPWGGLAGGFLGMFLLSIPVPILGTIVGAIAGCFLGAALVEMHARRRFGQSSKVGFFAALGFVSGMVLKTAIAMAMSVMLLFFAFRGQG